MAEDFTSGSFGEMSDSFSKFHDYQRMPFKGAGYSVLYTVLSGGRKLFLKALNRELGASAEHLARLRREYWILEKLYGNEHVVRCIGWREDAEVGPCIVMEYVDGESLTDYLKTNPSNKEKKRILNELLDALDFIHKHQIVHNDLKSENILVTRNGHNVKLIDFGYADGDSNIDKATGGTEAFASPELVRQETTDVRSDIYSLGFIIKALFPHCYGSVVRKCQHKEIEKRYQKVSEVGKAVDWRDRVKWLALAALAIAVAVWVWPKKEPEKVLPPEKNEPVPQVVAAPDTVVVVHEHHDTVVIEQPKSVKQNNSNAKAVVVNNPVIALDLDSVHQAYQALYIRFEKEIQNGMKNGKIAYWDYGEVYKDRFELELTELHKTMKPTDLAMQTLFEMDFKTVSEELVSQLSGLYADKLPSIGWIGQENPRKADSLRIELQRFYFSMNRDLFEDKLPHK
jgi:serine/threonine protein kinase